MKLKEAFSTFGTITSIAFRRNQDRHNGLGYGFINFESHEQATLAVNEGSKIAANGQPIFVDRFQKRQERQALLHKLYDERKRERTEKFKNMNLYVKNLEVCGLFECDFIFLKKNLGIRMTWMKPNYGNFSDRSVRPRLLS